MTDFEIPDWAQRGLVDRSRGRFVHDDVPAAETALVVVDMQNYFLDPASPAHVPAAANIVLAINDVAAALRGAGGHVVWIRTVYTKEAEASISHFHRILLKPETYQYRSKALAKGSGEANIWPGLRVEGQDSILDKTRFSAFTGEESGLDATLRRKGISAVWVAGTTTSVCCESTARDAMMHNYRTTMLHDCNASQNKEEHIAALLNFQLYFGDVAGRADVIVRLV